MSSTESKFQVTKYFEEIVLKKWFGNWFLIIIFNLNQINNVHWPESNLNVSSNKLWLKHSKVKGTSYFMALLLESIYFIAKIPKHKIIPGIKNRKFGTDIGHINIFIAIYSIQSILAPSPHTQEDNLDVSSIFGSFCFRCILWGVHFKTLLIDLYIPDCLCQFCVHKYHRSIISGSLDNFKGHWVDLLAA